MCNISNLRHPNQPIQLPTLATAVPNKDSHVHGSFPVASNNEVLSLTSAVTDAMKNVHHQAPRKPQSAHNGHHHPPVIVQHHYHDHAMEARLAGSEDIVRRPARGGVTTPFPDRLHELLDQFEADGRADIVSWQPHGRCFVIRKANEFKELLPEYFKLTKMSSFQRQLNLYGFQRLTRGRDRGAYYHEYFLRGMLHLSSKIERTKVKGTGVRARSNPAAEPNLWDLPWVGPNASNTNSSVAESTTPSVSSTASVASSTRSDSASVSSVESAPSSPTANHTPALVTPTGPASTLVDPSPAFLQDAALAPLPHSWTPLPAFSSLAAPPKLPRVSAAHLPSHIELTFDEPEEAPMEAVHVMSSSSSQAPPMSPVVPVSIMALATPLGFNEQGDCDDVVWSFGGKSFHYLDPFQLLEGNGVASNKVEPPAAQEMEDFVADMQLDELAEKLDDDEDNLDDDQVFMSMLEHVISE